MFDLRFRFDLMVGMNGQEGILFLVITGVPLDNGLSIDAVKQVLNGYCTTATPFSIELCVDYLLDEYEFSSISDDKSRAITLTYALGELSFRQRKVGPSCVVSLIALQFSPKTVICTFTPFFLTNIHA